MSTSFQKLLYCDTEFNHFLIKIFPLDGFRNKAMLKSDTSNRIMWIIDWWGLHLTTQIVIIIRNTHKEIMYTAIDLMDPRIRKKCTLTLRWLLHVSRMSSILLMFSSEINCSVPPDSEESGLVCLDLPASARDLFEGPAEAPPQDWAVNSSTRRTKERQVVLSDDKPQQHTHGCVLSHHIQSHHNKY